MTGSNTTTAAAQPACAIPSDSLVIQQWLFGRPETTQRAYGRAIARLADFLAGDGAGLPQASLTQLQSWARSLDLEGLAAASQAQAINAIKSFYSFAAAEHPQAYRNSAQRLEAPHVRRDLHRRVPAQGSMREVLAGDEDPLYRGAVALLYFTGCRVSEAASLRWCDVIGTGELDGLGREAVRLSLVGKGGKERAPKLTGQQWEMICSLLPGGEGEDPLLCKVAGEQLTRHQLYRMVRRAFGRSGQQRRSPHEMRHAHATHAKRAGCSDDLLMRQGGWADPRTLAGYCDLVGGESSADYLEV